MMAIDNGDDDVVCGATKTKEKEEESGERTKDEYSENFHHQKERN